MPRRGENIYKRKDGRWEGRYIKSRSASGKAQYGYIYAKSYRAVKEKLKDAQQSNVLQAVVPTKKSNFECIAREWLDSLRPTVKESTWNKYYNLLQLYLFPKFDSFSLNQISCDVIREHCNLLVVSGGKNAQGLSEKTVADILTVLRSIFRYASRKGYTLTFDLQTIQILSVVEPRQKRLSMSKR